MGLHGLLQGYLYIFLAEEIYRGLTDEISLYLIGGTEKNYGNPQSRPRLEPNIKRIQAETLLFQSASPEHIFKGQAYDI
jgi:hypothetical protein